MGLDVYATIGIGIETVKLIKKFGGLDEFNEWVEEHDGELEGFEDMGDDGEDRYAYYGLSIYTRNIMRGDKPPIDLNTKDFQERIKKVSEEFKKITGIKGKLMLFGSVSC